MWSDVISPYSKLAIFVFDFVAIVIRIIQCFIFVGGLDPALFVDESWPIYPTHQNHVQEVQ